MGPAVVLEGCSGRGDTMIVEMGKPVLVGGITMLESWPGQGPIGGRLGLEAWLGPGREAVPTGPLVKTEPARRVRERVAEPRDLGGDRPP